MPANRKYPDRKQSYNLSSEVVLRGLSFQDVKALNRTHRRLVREGLL
jgi:hypothetical protein